jgi:hypothetical protein
MMNPINRIIRTDTYTRQREQMDQKEVNKFEQAIEVHGYRGSSKKKHNGVVLIKPTDTQLLKSLEKFYETEKAYITRQPLLTKVADVKIVAHVENGNRAIGQLYTNQQRELVLVLMGFSNYNYALF